MAKKYKMMEWTDEKIKNFWDYESQFPENYFTYQVGKFVIDRLYKYFPNAKTALDYGSGPGFLIPYLMEKAIEVYALEFSPNSLKLINDKFGACKYFKGAFTIDELISSDKKFDLIMVLEVIEHINDRYLSDTISNIKKLLAKNGIAVFSTPNNEDLSKSMVYCPESDVIFHRWQHVKSWSKESMQTFLIRHGFEIVDIFDTNFSLPEKKASMIKKSIKIIRNIFKKPVKEEKLPHLVAIVKYEK